MKRAFLVSSDASKHENFQMFFKMFKIFFFNYTVESKKSIFCLITCNMGVNLHQGYLKMKEAQTVVKPTRWHRLQFIR